MWVDLPGVKDEAGTSASLAALELEGVIDADEVVEPELEPWLPRSVTQITCTDM